MHPSTKLSYFWDMHSGLKKKKLDISVSAILTLESSIGCSIGFQRCLCQFSLSIHQEYIKKLENEDWT